MDNQQKDYFSKRIDALIKSITPDFAEQKAINHQLRLNFDSIFNEVTIKDIMEKAEELKKRREHDENESSTKRTKFLEDPDDTIFASVEVDKILATLSSNNEGICIKLPTSSNEKDEKLDKMQEENKPSPSLSSQISQPPENSLDEI